MYRSKNKGPGYVSKLHAREFIVAEKKGPGQVLELYSTDHIVIP
jgi:hypothetical protein